MKLKIVIDLDNSAYTGEDDEVTETLTIGDVLSATNFNGKMNCEVFDLDIPVRDINGNTCGRIKVVS